MDIDIYYILINVHDVIVVINGSVVDEGVLLTLTIFIAIVGVAPRNPVELLSTSFFK